MNHKNLEVWKMSMELVVDIYNLTRTFPNDEKFGIVNQMRRAAISVPSNIAEGCARDSDKEILRFLDISRGSLSELETQVLICEQLGYLKSEKLFAKIEEVGKMLSGLKNYLKNKNI